MLAEQVQRVEPVVNGAVLAAIAQVLPERAAAQKELRDAVYTAMDALRGIFVGSFADSDPARLRRRWDRASDAAAPRHRIRTRRGAATGLSRTRVVCIPNGMVSLFTAASGGTEPPERRGPVTSDGARPT